MGTPQELTDPGGKIVWSAHYRAYGNVIKFDINEISNPLRFQGQYYDEESGLHYNRHRYYNPNTGRYLTPDPIKLAGGLNSYQYVPNPTGWVDPLGLMSVKGECPGGLKTSSTSRKANDFGRVEGTYSAIKPGPLTDNIAETFSGGRYSVVTIDNDISLYRAGTANKPLGQFFSSEPPISILQTRIDKAVLPQWPNGAKSPVDTVFRIKIPSGTKLYIGETGSQGGVYIGGTQQIVVSKPWTIDGVKVISSEPLK